MSAYNMSDPKVAKQINKSFPMYFSKVSAKKAEEIVHSYASSFKTVEEREIFTQLVQEGRQRPEAIANAGLPGGALFEGRGLNEAWGEVVNFIGHLGTPTTGITVPHTSKGVPTSTSEQGEGKKGQEESNSITSALKSFIEGYGIRALEVIGGGLLLLFGLWIVAKRELPKAVPV